MFKKIPIFVLCLALIFQAVGLPPTPTSAAGKKPTPTMTMPVGDAPADGPGDTQQPGLMAAASTPAGATIAEYNLPQVNLRVGDGYNLDQYLFWEDGEIAFGPETAAAGGYSTI